MIGATAAVADRPPAPASGVAPERADELCGPAYGSGFTLVRGKVEADWTSTPRPPKGVARLDPRFGTCVVRVTDHAREAPVDFARSDYSRRQAFNADGTRLLAYANNGAWHLYDANTLAWVRELPGPGGDAEPQWDPADPARLFYVPTNGGMRLLSLDVVKGRTTVAADFDGRLPWDDIEHVWTKSEGSPSSDARYWCFMAEDASFVTRGVFVYDLQRSEIVGTRTLSFDPDHVSMSPSGRWCVVSGGEGEGGTVAWSADFSDSRKLHHTTEHSDLAIGASGHDVYAAVDYQSNAGDFFMVDIDTGKRTVLFPTYSQSSATAYHVSGKAYRKPGWILVSTYMPYGNRSLWYQEKLFAIELWPDPRILNLGHHHSTHNGYWTEPHATVNRDFTRILFSSNWGNDSETDVDAFMVRLPAGAVL